VGPDAGSDPGNGAVKAYLQEFGGADAKDCHAVVILGGHSADVIATDIEVEALLRAATENSAAIGGIGAGIMPMIRCGILAGKKMLVIAGEDFEDIELAVPVMEYIYRGAKVILATFTPVIRSRPPLVGLDVVQGNFGMSVPFQEIPESYYTIKKLADVRMDEFDALQIPGAFCPYNIVETGTPLEFLKQADSAGKIITYICHGGIPVAAADLIKGKKATGWQASKDSIEIMGGEYNENWAAVVDGRQVSGRTPPEIPEYVDAVMVALLRG
jgi:protease I